MRAASLYLRGAHRRQGVREDQRAAQRHRVDARARGPEPAVLPRRTAERVRANCAQPLNERTGAAH